MPVIPFNEYKPDLPDFQNDGATVAKNVVPLTTKSYGPFQALKAYLSDPLPYRCQGAFGAKSYAGTSYLFAGDINSLFIWGPDYIDSFFLDGFFERYFFEVILGSHVEDATFATNFFYQNFFNTSLEYDTSWQDISEPLHYSVGEESFWQFVQFGNKVIACCLGNYIQQYDLDEGMATTFTNLSDDAPQAAFLAVIRDFVMFANIVSSDGHQPNLVWWPAIDDPTNWPTPGTAEAAAVQSDYQLLPEGGAINGIIGAVGGADGAIFLDEAIYRVMYVGLPAIFQFDKVEKVMGTRVPGSIINVGSIAFYLGIDGFYAFDGTNSVAIGHDKIDRMFYADFDQVYYYRVVAGADIKNKQVMWAYPGSGHIGGTPNKILVYNWVSNRWSLVEQNVEYFFRSYTLGYSLDDLDSFGTMETLPYSLDSRIWSGGTSAMSGFDSAHTYGIFDGATLAAMIETGEFDGTDHQRVFVSGIRPIVDSPSVSVAVGIRDLQSGAVTYKTPTTPGVDGICPQRISSRYIRARVQIPAGTAWTHAQGIEPVVQQDGDR